MLIVTGSLTASPDSLEELRAACIAHSRRSRAEPGCISHAVHADCEEPLRLVFVERWADRAALDAHFRVPESNAFMKTARRLCVKAQGPEILATTPG